MSVCLREIIVRWLGLAALSVTVVASASQTISFDAIPNQIFGASPFTITARASSGLPVSFVSTTTAVCKLASGLVMLLGVGTCSITSSQSGNANYGAAASVTRSFTVSSWARPSGTLMAAAGGPFTVGTTPASVAVGDFNGDGFQDLAAANTGSNNVTVLLGNGLGGFTSADGSPFAVGGGPSFVVVGDFNGDGIQDLMSSPTAKIVP